MVQETIIMCAALKTKQFLCLLQFFSSSQGNMAVPDKYTMHSVSAESHKTQKYDSK